MEKRLFLAFILSVAVFVVWTALFPPPKPPAVEPVGEVVAKPTAAASPTPAEEKPQREAAPEVEAEEPAEVEEDAIAGPGDETVRLGNEQVEVVMSSTGAAITHLRLVEFDSDDGEVLDLVQTVEDEARALPLQLVTGDGVDARPYAVEAVDGGYVFRWADGAGSGVEKRVSLAAGEYRVAVEVRAWGEMASAALSVGTGMRDRGAREEANRFSRWGDVVYLSGEELEERKREKVKETEEVPGQGLRFVGFTDSYFLSLYMPAERLSAVRVIPLEVTRTTDEGGDEVTDTVLEVLLESESGAFAGELFAAPKEYNLLKRVGHGVDATLNFGFFHPISVLFLKALRWIHGLVGNWGVAIILLTLAIRIVLFPLMHTSTVSMRKMQKLQPKVKAIQEKYRKNKSDPQVRAKMNQEMMELYRSEGVNPMGGCLPMLVQLPILWALYTLFAHAIELRHAPFIFWIQDLSTKDPYYITPVLMTATMWLQQKLAPQAGDPQQQRIFRMMPLIFGIMFLGFPSGLVLYWLTNNVITILQQELTLRLIGERGKGKAKAGQRTRKDKA